VVLSYSVKNKTRFVMLKADEVAEVRAATRRFRAAKAKPEAAADNGLKQLVASRARRCKRRVSTSCATHVAI